MRISILIAALVLALAMAMPAKKIPKKHSAAKIKEYKPLVYRTIPGCVECRASGYYIEGAEKGNGNNKEGKQKK